MPFLSEEIWQRIEDRKKEEALIVAKWPSLPLDNQHLIKEFEFASSVVTGIRNIRKEKNIAAKELLELKVIDKEKFSEQWDVMIQKLGHLESIERLSTSVEGALSFSAPTGLD